MEGLLLDWRLIVGFNCVGGVRKIELETKWSKPELMPELRYDIAWSNSIRLIDQNQNMVGIVSLDRAIPNAEYAELDLVC
ncbi:Translation initiation factor 3 protein [Trifolium repens]|nr:Translation initiation factor 3 protein [Trifolium repens]